MKKRLFTLLFMLCALSGYAQNEAQDLACRLRNVDPQGYRMAIEDMRKSNPELQLDDKWQKALESLEKGRTEMLLKLQSNDRTTITTVQNNLKILDNTLLQNPLLKGKAVYAIERKLGNARSQMSGGLGLAPSNFQNNSEIHNPAKGWNNRMVRYSDLGGRTKSEEVFKPTEGMIMTDVEPHFSGDKFLYSSIGTNGRWHLFEYDIKSKTSKQVTPAEYEDFDSFDGCYTPDGKYIFCATATFLGLPCTNGANKMCGLFSYDPKTGVSRQLTFDQDSNWEPVVNDDGQIFYLRWEYADLPHSNSRIIFTMNPDGTGQKAYYGSGSYFPTSLFGARPIPASGGKFVGVVSGHHSVSRSGMLMVFDPQQGVKEAEGVVTEIPYRGRKVQPVVRDRQPDGIYPQFLHPFPLNEKYFVVSMKASPTSLWGVYLVDVFNNMTLIAQNEEMAILEPKLIEKVNTPPVIPSSVNMAIDSATIFIQDIYFGPGLKGIPRGEVKKLRIGGYDFSPLNQGGLLGTIGLDGPWDVKRIFGEVDVEADGSVMCRVPANTALFVQPLDKDGKALQVMRSWFTAMPGEVLSCLGCHEDQRNIVVPKRTEAAIKAPQSIKPFQGYERGFSFEREVQPVLDRACVACHNGDKKEIPNFKGGIKLTDWSTQISGRGGPQYAGKFTESYYQLQRYVRRPGIESDMEMLKPMDVHADQSELFQVLNKGHHGVKLTADEVATLALWIDFNAQFHGRRSDIPNYPDTKKAHDLRSKYLSMLSLKACDMEVIAPQKGAVEAQMPMQPILPMGDTSTIKGWPHYRGERINNYEAWNQLNLGRYQVSYDLGDGVMLDMIKVPVGEFKMGGNRPEERPVTRQRIENSYWIGRYEITNEQYAQFDREHRSRDEHRHGYQFGRKGYSLDDPKQPVVRVSWNEAMEFCEWLSQKLGMKVTLPSEMEWEWAARSGSATDYPFGNQGVDYSLYANVGDQSIRQYAACTAYKFYESTRVIDNPSRYDDWVPHDTLYNDAAFLSMPVGRYRANAWDLYDMTGNVWEWTRSEYLPYPYNEQEANDTSKSNVKRTVRGGSWYDRPEKATSAYRMGYRDYQPVFNVGFRVVIHP